MNMRDKIARAIWETWRKSQHASDEESLLTWEELSTADADSYPGLAELTELAFAESDAVLDAIREPTPAMVQAGGQAFDDTLGETEACWIAMIDAAKEQR